MEIRTRCPYSVTIMARRSRNTEVLISGDAVDNRQRFQTRETAPLKATDIPATAPAPEPAPAPAPPPPKPKPKAESGPSDASKRLRRQPKVIDARKYKPEEKAPEVEKPEEPALESPPAAKLEADPPPAPAGLAPPPPAPKPVAAKPREQPPEKPKVKQPATPKQSAKVAATVMVDSMVGRLKSEAQRKGSISVAYLDALQAEFAKQAEKLSQALERSFDSFVEAKERAEWGMKRDQPFDRVIVKAFSELFLDEDYTRFDRVSRRMLPGFFMALNMMLGEELVNEYQENCQLLVERLREEHGSAFDWELVYGQPEAKALMLDAAITIATYFADYDRRSNWFIELINGNLGPMDGAPKEEAGWEMTPTGFKRFLDHLFKDLRDALATDSGKLRITKRHGAETCAQIF